MTVPSELIANSGVDRDSPLASPMRRLAAHVLDSLMFSVTTLPVLLAFLVRDDGGARLLGAIGGAATLGLIVGNGWSVQREGQSLGKRLLGLRVVRADGRRIGLVRIVLLRNLLPALIEAVPVAGLIFTIADALFVLREHGERRSLHDRMANSIVISLRTGRTVARATSFAEHGGQTPRHPACR